LDSWWSGRLVARGCL